MLSPVTGKSTAILLEKLDSRQIIELYRKNLNTDVSRFFENLSSVDVMQCPDTGYRFFAPFSIAGDGRFYEDLQNGYDNYYRDWKWENQFATGFLQKDMHVLDIGCGKGAFLTKIKNSVASSIGLEFNDKAIEKARKEGLEVRKEMIETHAAGNPEKYDAVCFFQVLEHICEVKQFLDAALMTLKPGGLLIIGVPNSDPWLLRQDKFHTLNLPPHHAGLWNREVFHKLEKFYPIQLEKIGYEPLTAIRQQWIAVLKYRRLNLLAKLVQLLPGLVFTLFGRYFGRFYQGISMVAVFQKNK